MVKLSIFSNEIYLHFLPYFTGKIVISTGKVVKFVKSDVYIQYKVYNKWSPQVEVLGIDDEPKYKDHFYLVLTYDKI